MYCRSCGAQINDQAVICVSCGVPVNSGKSYCQACGAPSVPNAEVCVKCGVRLMVGAASDAKSKVAAGLLGIFLGCFGVHRFYLGYNEIAVCQLILGLLGFVTCGFTTTIASIWGLIEGIMILTGSINRDAQGRPLKD